MIKKAKPAKTTDQPPSYFDNDYYNKYYFNEKTRIREDSDLSLLVDFVIAYLRQLNIPISKVCDVGCGLGEWGKEIKKRLPSATYYGIEYSEYLCKEYGWHHGSVTNFKIRRNFDLIICQSVLQYLSNNDVRKAIENISAHCKGALYLEIITKKDWEDHCDQTVTDGNIYLRTGDWYKKVISTYFRSLGGGLFVKKDLPVILYELEEG